MARFVWVAHNTFLELVRERTLNVILLFGLVVIGAANVLSGVSIEVYQFQFVKDFGLGAMTVVGGVMAVLATAQMLPREIENRTLFTVLSKPIRRWEFLVGKYAGILLLLAVSVVAMGVVLQGVLMMTEANLVRMAEQEVEGLAEGKGANERAELERELTERKGEWRAEARSWKWLQAWLLVYGKLSLVAAIALMLSTVSSSTMFTVVVTFLVYLAGHLQSAARELWAGPEGEGGMVGRLFVALVSVTVPDFEVFAVIEELVLGNEAVSWAMTGSALQYAWSYVAVMVVAACVVFGNREW